MCMCGYNQAHNLARHIKGCNKKWRLLYLELKSQKSDSCDMEKMIALKEEIRELNKKVAVLTSKKIGYNYIIHEREAIRMNENVYKIGRSHDVSQRLRQYPKGSKLLHCRKTTDQLLSEKILLKVFQSQFTQRLDLGTEYFEGDLSKMIQQFDNLLDTFA